MKKAFVACIIALFFVLFLLVYFLFNPLDFSRKPGKSAESTPSSKYDWDKILSKTTPSPPQNLYSALQKNDSSFCDTEHGISSGLCREIFSFAKEKCPAGKPIERIFCVAFLNKKKELCSFISLEWYAVTCRAIIDANAAECLTIDSLENRALCLRDLASNLEGLDCSSLQPGWQHFCIAFHDSNSSKCNLIKSSEIKQQCIELFNI